MDSQQPTKPRLRRTLEHLAAGMTITAPVNALSVYALSSVMSSPALLAVTTTAVATLFSGVRTYVVLYLHERPQPTT